MVTAPYGEDTVLTLTGEVDFRHDIGRAQAVTSFGDGRADDTRTLYFTARRSGSATSPACPRPSPRPAPRVRCTCTVP